MTRLETCRLCGREASDVRVAFTRWARPIAERRFGAVARCEDRAACRTRVEDQGAEWVVADRTTEGAPAWA